MNFTPVYWWNAKIAERRQQCHSQPDRHIVPDIAKHEGLRKETLSIANAGHERSFTQHDNGKVEVQQSSIIVRPKTAK